MNLDHVSFAAGPQGYEHTAQTLAESLNIEFYDGGVHPRFGTRNLILPLAHGHYIEVVEALEHPAAFTTPYGQAVRARSELGGGWMGWCVALDDLTPLEEALGREAVDGNRTPEGGPELKWKQLGVKGLIADPQLPYFIKWISPADQHPSNRLEGNKGVAIESLQIAGNRDRLREWLLTADPKPIPEIGINWTAPNAQPGIMSVTFTTPSGGQVTI